MSGANNGLELKKERIGDGGIGRHVGKDLKLELVDVWVSREETSDMSRFSSRDCGLGSDKGDRAVA